jgi:hypothetical protein
MKKDDYMKIQRIAIELLWMRRINKVKVEKDKLILIIDNKKLIIKNPDKNLEIKDV